MTVFVKGSDWFLVFIVGCLILYIMKPKRENMLIEEDFFSF